MNNKLRISCVLEGEPTSKGFIQYMDSEAVVFDLTKRLMDLMGLVFNPLDSSNVPTLWSANLGKLKEGSPVLVKLLSRQTKLEKPTQALSTLPQDATIIVTVQQERSAVSGTASSARSVSQLMSESEILGRKLPDLVYDRAEEPSKATTNSPYRRTPALVTTWTDFQSAAASKKYSTEQKFNRNLFEFNTLPSAVVDEASLTTELYTNVFKVLNGLVPPGSIFIGHAGADLVGEPPVLYRVPPYEARILIEVKTKWDLECDDLVQKHNDEMRLIADGLEPTDPVWPYVLRIFAYLSFNRLKYGVLTTYDQTWFLKREEGVLLVSPTILHRDHSPTVLQCYKHIMDLANEDHFSPPAPLVQSSNCRRDHHRAHRLDLQDVDLGEFQLQEILGSGRSGRVFRALWQDQPVALKVCDLYKHPDYEDEMLTEVTVYQVLESLQGVYIPRLLFAGYDGGMFAVAMEMAGSPVEVESLSDENRLKIVDCLTAIHQHGILHNDIRLENILVCRDNDQLQARFIDFALSKRSTSEHEMQREMMDLKRLLEID
ncbi:hypothetical protein EMPS_10760 [Entomortierella parvispora]|uniref:Protein kinase domain-containing protein n=1 Tax=Entomortierella parvispora TaxID=205924 RepID=A0A9P3M1B4_9FUNG|nr:hypothetical protein EMPS_10760 [Entomortierella parvispora]